MSSLKQRTDQVVGDKKLLKALTTYVEERRDMLCVTIFDGKGEICTSPEIAKLLEQKTDLIAGLMKVFEDKAKLDREASKHGEKPDGDQTKPELKSNKQITLPPLFAPFKDEKKGWTKSNVADQLTLYINLLGYGVGGDNSLVPTSKYKETSKPAWFPDSQNFDNYTHPSKAKMKENEDIIESMYKHFGLDINTHVVPNGIERKKKSKINASILEDRVIIDAGLPMNKVDQKEDFDFRDFVADVKKQQLATNADPSGPTPQKTTNTGRVPLKRTAGPDGLEAKRKKSEDGKPAHEKSAYEIVRDNNIAERKAMEKALGFDKK